MCMATLDNWQLISEYQFGLINLLHLSAVTFATKPRQGIQSNVLKAVG